MEANMQNDDNMEAKVEASDVLDRCEDMGKEMAHLFSDQYPHMNILERCHTFFTAAISQPVRTGELATKEDCDIMLNYFKTQLRSLSDTVVSMEHKSQALS